MGGRIESQADGTGPLGTGQGFRARGIVTAGHESCLERPIRPLIRDSPPADPISYGWPPRHAASDLYSGEQETSDVLS